MWRKKVHWWSSQVLSSIIEMIEERALKEDASCLFFPYLKKHWEVHRNEKEYLKRLFEIFYNIFFENIGNIPVRERNYIWESHFPPEWKVTKENLDKNIFVSRISLNEFLIWVEGRIKNPEKEFDKKFNDVSSNLFPEVEPGTWAMILVFCFSNNGVKSVIEHPWNFSIQRFRAYSYSEEEDLELKKRNTFELTVVLSKYYPLFRDISTEKNLENYIKELNGLKDEYKNDSSKEWKRLELLRIFNEMRDFLNKPELH